MWHMRMNKTVRFLNLIVKSKLSVQVRQLLGCVWLEGWFRMYQKIFMNLGKWFILSENKHMHKALRDWETFLFKQKQRALKTLEYKVSLMAYVTWEVRPSPSAFSIW